VFKDARAMPLLRIKAAPNLAAILFGPPMLAFLPALTLGAFWIGGEAALVAVALGLPFVLALFWAGADAPRAAVPCDPATGLLLRAGFAAQVADIHAATADPALKSALFAIDIDDIDQVSRRHGADALDRVLQSVAERILSSFRTNDLSARLDGGQFAVCLTPVRHLDLEICLQMAGRLQAAIEEPIALDGTTIYLTCSVGFCLRSRAPGEAPDAWQAAAFTAATEAQQNGPSAIRAFSAEMHKRSQSRTALRADAAEALENGQIRPWYQPQISTDTGKITGFEALARWQHPVRGLIAPGEFLPVLDDCGLMERLGEIMLYSALTALKAWDSANADVPRVGLNLSQAELNNPRLVDKLRWELDRFDLAPDRLTVEILETVVTDAPGDVVVRNIRGLGEIGCGIDLDDYGTGHASIASIKRFNVSRIKIDRSFVMKSDRDPEQQRLVGALLTMADRLGLETLAEGVETVGEHALLAQLGCGHVQGYGIARPMPFDHTLDWIARHNAKLEDAPEITRGRR
jgi:diguanylate cyclase (GGDEF)-like protein